MAADPARSWFLGDKPANDAAAASAAGITRRVQVRGGSTPDHALQAVQETGLGTAVVDHPGDLCELLSTDYSPALL